MNCSETVPLRADWRSEVMQANVKSRCGYQQRLAASAVAEAAEMRMGDFALLRSQLLRLSRLKLAIHQDRVWHGDALAPGNVLMHRLAAQATGAGCIVGSARRAHRPLRSRTGWPSCSCSNIASAPQLRPQPQCSRGQAQGRQKLQPVCAGGGGGQLGKGGSKRKGAPVSLPEFLPLQAHANAGSEQGACVQVNTPVRVALVSVAFLYVGLIVILPFINIFIQANAFAASSCQPCSQSASNNVSLTGVRQWLRPLHCQRAG